MAERLPPNYSAENIRSPDFTAAKTHIVTLDKGDCIYIPAYWWYQIEASAEEATLTVTHWYDISSTWVELIFNGIEENIL